MIVCTADEAPIWLTLQPTILINIVMECELKENINY